jgi:hypothetical protein
VATFSIVFWLQLAIGAQAQRGGPCRKPDCTAARIARGSATSTTAIGLFGFDVLVQPKQVGRVILVLQGDEAPVVVCIGGLDPGPLLCIQVIDVDFARRERLHCRPELAGPLDMTRVLPDIVPLRDDVVIPLVIAKPEGGLIPVYSARGAVDMKKPDQRHRGWHGPAGGSASTKSQPESPASAATNAMMVAADVCTAVARRLSLGDRYTSVLVGSQ